MAIKNTCIIVMIMIAGLVSVPQIVHASPPSSLGRGPSLGGVVRCIGNWDYHCITDPSFDGFGICIAYRAKWCASQSLTTSKEEDAVILVVICYCTPDTPSIIDSAGLNYTLRVSYSASPGFGPLTLGEYYATAGSPLTSDNITVAHSNHSFLGPIQVFAIHPGETKTAFDRNQSLPITLTCPWTQTPDTFVFHDCSASTGRLAHDFVIAITAIEDAGPCPTLTSSGFSELVFDGSSLDIHYRIVRESESNVTFTCAGTDQMAMVFDAISLHPGHQARDTSD